MISEDQNKSNEIEARKIIKTRCTRFTEVHKVSQQFLIQLFWCREQGEVVAYEWERLEISSRKLELPREHFMQRWANKDRSSMHLTEAEDIKNRWQEYTEDLFLEEKL